MFISHLAIGSLRNIHSASFDFTKSVCSIHGDNAQGKTTILEAIFFLSTGKSFRTDKLNELISHDKISLYINATFVRENVTNTIRIEYSKTHRKVVYNGKEFSSFSPLIGLFPCVILSPKDLLLLVGSPQDRRRFLNLHIAQEDPLYVYHLTRYSKALKERNALLKMKKSNLIHVFDSILAVSGVYIAQKRSTVVDELRFHAKESYSTLSQKNEQLSFSLKNSPSQNIEEYQKKLKESVSRDITLGFTNYGVHKHDIVFELDGYSAKTYASEGQKKSIALSYKLAESKRLEISCNDIPILLIDDFSLQLDKKRSDAFTSIISSHPQVILTSPKILLNGDQYKIHKGLVVND